MEALVSTLWPYLAAIGAALATLGGVYLRGRRAAAEEAEFKRLREQSAARGRADEAADHYRRDGGAAGRLRDGRF